MQKHETINKFIFIFILVIVITGALFTDSDSGVGSICLFKKITGLYCPFCGLTHSFNSILHLNFEESFRYNALGLFLFLILLIFALKLILELIFGVSIHLKPFESKYFLPVIISIFVIYWIIRNFIL